MNTRSLRFQLVAWYAGLLTGCFVLIGAATYLVLQNSLVGALRETQLRRARQVGQLLLDEIRGPGEGRVGEEVQARYAPDLNGRFVRITRSDGSLVYVSNRPKDQTFVPAELPPTVWPSLAGYAITTRRGSTRLSTMPHPPLDGPRPVNNARGLYI